MRIQFSMLTMLLCMTAFAAVCAIAVKLPVDEQIRIAVEQVTPNTGYPVYETLRHPPAVQTIAWRLALWAPLANSTTLATVWMLRKRAQRMIASPERNGG